MRLLTILFCVTLLAGCASGKKTAEKERSGRRKPEPAEQRLGAEPSQTSRRPAAEPARMPAPVAADWRITSVKARFLNKDSSFVRIFLSTTLQKGYEFGTVEDLSSRFMLNYVVYPDYNSRERLAYANVPLTAESIMRDGNNLLVIFDVKKPASAINGILLAEFTETSGGRKVLHDLPIRFKAVKLSDRFALYSPKTGLPRMRNYVTVDDTVLIRDVAGTSRTLQAFRYRHDFDPASSPMNTTPRPAPKSLDTDSTFTITTNQPIVLPQEGLYFFLEDTTDSYGIGLVVADERFPKLTRPEKLVKPVLYMSTNQEIGDLNRSQEIKKALDRYWLTLMSGNPDLARQAIRAYYNRVEEANRLFTTYKEGWKTDKGMIYIVLGAPDRVQRSRDREVWVYNQRSNVAEINFTFNRKPNQFVEDHYELVRYVEYQPIWYPAVEAWRTGAIRE